VSGRIRSIKPEWLDDEKLALASSDARTLSIALILLADDYGNGRSNRVMLAGRVFPGKVLETLENALAELADWFVTLYEVDGQSYFSLPNWDKHQKVDKPGKPRVPGPSGTIEKVPETLEKPPATVATVRASRGSRSYVPGPGTGPGPAPDPEPPTRVGSTTAPEAAEKVLRELEEPRDTAPPQTQVRERLPSNLDEAIRIPVCERATLVVDGRCAAQWVQPERWREVVDVEAALAAAEGREPMPLGRYDRDAGVRAIVELYAAGYMPGALREAVQKLARDPWWREKKRGLSSLTPEVMRRVLTGDTGDAAGRELLARVDASLAKGKRSQADEGGTQLGSLLGSIGGAR
jgi:hypothetical protein